MRYSTYCLISGILFALVALVHLSRIVQGWDLTVGGDIVPLWVNWAGMIITGILAFYGFRLGIKKPIADIKI